LAATDPAGSGSLESESGRTLSASQLALARGRAYDLLGQLYVRGITPANLACVLAMPELAHRVVLPLDADGAAADHYHLFGFNVYPYQSLFLDPAGLLGGPVAERVGQTYRQLGFRPGTGAESADHIGIELGLLSFLSAAEAEALASGELERAQWARERQLAFLDEHLLRWISPLTLAIGQQNQPFYGALAEVTFDLVQEQAAGLYAEFGRKPKREEPALTRLDLLGDDSTGLKEIVEFLLTPIYSGIYLSRDDIGRMARQQGVPRGFGDRQQLLLNMMRSAAKYESLGQVIDGLGELARQWESAYVEMMQLPAVGAPAAMWRSRAATTVTTLGQMRSRIDSLSEA
jgi:TorA maturation chaperone TorD